MNGNDLPFQKTRGCPRQDISAAMTTNSEEEEKGLQGTSWRRQLTSDPCANSRNKTMKRRTSFEDVRAVDELLHQPSHHTQPPLTHDHPSNGSLGGPSRLGIKRGRSPSLIDGEDQVHGESPFRSGPTGSYEVNRSKITTVSKLAEGLTAIQEHENELAGR